MIAIIPTHFVNIIWIVWLTIRGGVGYTCRIINPRVIATFLDIGIPHLVMINWLLITSIIVVIKANTVHPVRVKQRVDRRRLYCCCRRYYLWRSWTWSYGIIIGMKRRPDKVGILDTFRFLGWSCLLAVISVHTEPCKFTTCIVTGKEIHLIFRMLAITVAYIVCSVWYGAIRASKEKK